MLEITMFELGFFTISSAISLLVLFYKMVLVPTCMINNPGLKSCKVGFRYSYISIVFTVVKGIPLAKNLWLTDLLNRYPSSFLYYHLELKILFPSIFSLFDQLLLSHQFVSLKSNLWLFLSKLQLQHSDLFYQRYYESFQQLFLQGYL